VLHVSVGLLSVQYLLDSAWSAHHNARHLLLDLIFILSDWNAAEEVSYLDSPKPGTEALKFVTNLQDMLL
jgi:hypothetical protein